MEQAAIEHADLLLASSANTAEFCAERYGIALEDVTVVHSGVDAGRFHPMARPDDSRYPKVLFVGNLVKSKGLDVVAEAVARLRSRYPSACLRAIGRGDREGPLFRQLEELSDRVGMDAIDVVGAVPHAELPEHYAWCDVFAGPSVHEPGPGNIYLEAMACGRPVVASIAGGAPEVVLDRKTGLLVEPRDADAVTAAIGELAGDGALAAAFGRAGRELVERRFSLEAYTDRIERLYLDAVAGATLGVRSG
jgi:glycosyltransferase involved in cell wall biosynthesis